jgi:serine/threonine protein phosphatase PrpC
MAEILFGYDTHPGGRKYNEDRCAAEAFVTAGGLSLSVAIVCDGVGGEERGERAAQLAIDTVLAALRQSPLTSPTELLKATVQTANTAVYNEAQRLGAGERMACTLVLAVVVDGQTLYVANVGDSRAYLCREGQLQPLTRDHIFANVMVWTGKLSAEAAASNPDANRVMRVLGPKPNLQVDLGLYLTTTDYGTANRAGLVGLPLKTGDSILLCSDGLVKNTAATGQPLIAEKEIIRTLDTTEGQPAARALMSTALGRIPVSEPVDNISVAVLQTADPRRAANQAKIKQIQHEQQQREQRRKLLMVLGLVAVPLLLLLIGTLVVFGWFFNQATLQAGATATGLARATELAAHELTRVAGFTPTPSATFTPSPTPTLTPTAIPTLSEGEVAKLYEQDQFLHALLEDALVSVPAGETRYVAINHNLAAINGPANLHALGHTQFRFDSVDDKKIELIALTGSDFFMHTRPYPNGAEIKFDGRSLAFQANGCVAVKYAAADKVIATCFDGACQYRVNTQDDYKPIDAGWQLLVTWTDGAAQTDRQAISRAEMTRYWELLGLTSAGRADSQSCGVLPPPTATPRPPTKTPTLAITVDAGVTETPGLPTDTPRPPDTVAPPTDTPPAPAETPQPAPTITPQQPTATPTTGAAQNCLPNGSPGQGQPTCTPPAP